MYRIRAAGTEDLDQAVSLIARSQADPAQLIGFHGETTAEISDELHGMRPDWASGAVVATDQAGQISGVLSVDADRAVDTAWLYGPYVDVPADHPATDQVWRNTADELFETATRLPRCAGIGRMALFGHRRHRLLADFAARHDFTTGATRRVFDLTGSALREVLVRSADQRSTLAGSVVALPASPDLRAEVIDLYRRSFPSRPVSDQDLLTGGRGHTVVVLAGPDGLIGYAAGYPQEDELYVDMVAVRPDRRSVGAGRALVGGLLRELAARHGARPRAAAVITLGNDASERMFAALGFTVHLELVDYTWRCER